MSRLPFSSPGDLLDPGIEPGSPALQAESLPTELHASKDGQHQMVNTEIRLIIFFAAKDGEAL